MSSNGAGAAVAAAFAKVTREPEETDEQLARRMFYLQMEIYSAHAGRDLYREGDFELLPDLAKQSWTAIASTIK